MSVLPDRVDKSDGLRYWLPISKKDAESASRELKRQKPQEAERRRSKPWEDVGTNEDQMFAVIKTGGKQYNVAADSTITVMSLAGAPGDKITFAEVLMLGGESPKFGAPFVSGASVTAEIVGHARGPKVIAFKKRRRQNSKRKRGHRQDLTTLKILDIVAG